MMGFIYQGDLLLELAKAAQNGQIWDNQTKGKRKLLKNTTYELAN